MTYCSLFVHGLERMSARRVPARTRALTSPTCKEVEMASDRICSIDGCCKPADKRGWCSAHYSAWRRNGDPAARKAVEYGLPLKWLKAQVGHNGDECLIWPFGDNGNGYGQVRFEGTSRYPHRLICAWSNGAAPSPSHQAAHSCGNRACVNPRHLRWTDQSANELDKVAHGRDMRGERHHNAKLTEDEVQQIRALDGSLTHEEIAEKFGVGSVQVHRVIRRKRWGWLS